MWKERTSLAQAFWWTARHFAEMSDLAKDSERAISLVTKHPGIGSMIWDNMFLSTWIGMDYSLGNSEGQ